MSHSSSLALCGILLLISYFVVSKVRAYLRISKFKHERGCLPALQLPQTERIVGWGLLNEMSRHEKAHTLNQFIRSGFVNQNTTTWTANVMGGSIVMTSDPENIKAILAAQFEEFGLGHRGKEFAPLLGHGIFTSDGAEWHNSRALVRPAFTRGQVGDLSLFESHIQQFLRRLPKDGSTIDLGPIFFRFTLDTALEFLIGDSGDSSNDAMNRKKIEFGTAFDYSQRKLGDFGTHGWTRYVWYKRSFFKSCKYVHDFVDEFVLKALQTPPNEEKGSQLDHRTERYVFLKELVTATRDPKRIRDEMLNILLAGRDTTASLLTTAFHVLARQPTIWEKLKQEVDELGGEAPNYETLKDMKYLRYFLNECLRLYPVVPLNSRVANRNTTIPRGGGLVQASPVFVAKGQNVSYSIYSMHRSKELYGERAEEFLPERWETLRPGWHYLPFNGGPRICPGQQFALTEASYTIVRILQNFSGIESRDTEPWTEDLTLTSASLHGAKVALLKA